MRTASEVLRSLEQRIARLEGQSFRSASVDDIPVALKMLQGAGFKLVKGISGTYTFSFEGAPVKFTESDLSYLDDVKSFLKQVRQVEINVKMKMGMGKISQKDLNLEFKNQFGRMKGANMIYALYTALLEHNDVRVASDAFSSKRSASLTAHHRKVSSMMKLNFKVYTDDYDLLEEGRDMLLDSAVKHLSKVFGGRVSIDGGSYGEFHLCSIDVTLTEAGEIMSLVERKDVAHLTIPAGVGREPVYAQDFYLSDGRGRTIAEGDDLIEYLTKAGVMIN